jgi:catechol 2,3-dioxygenase-like lactoylglutathione lyase family enzyme
MYGVRTSTILLPSQLGQRERLRSVDSSVAARRFYRGVLGGRQVWPADSRKGLRSLWFLVGDTLIEVDPARRLAPETVELAVDAPNDLAEQCWNAGYTVRLRDADADDSCSAFLITDPFGRTIALTPRDTRQSANAIAG